MKTKALIEWAEILLRRWHIDTSQYIHHEIYDSAIHQKDSTYAVIALRTETYASLVIEDVLYSWDGRDITVYSHGEISLSSSS